MPIQANVSFINTPWATPAFSLRATSQGWPIYHQANTAFSDKPYDPHYAPWPALGNVLILLSQALMAGLFVSEETVMKAEKVYPITTPTPTLTPRTRRRGLDPDSDHPHTVTRCHRCRCWAGRRRSAQPSPLAS